MDRHQYLMDMRQEGKLKGLKPSFVFLKNNLGKIYNEGMADFILSFKNGILYFQRMSAIFHTLKPKYDFELNAKRFKTYKFERRNYSGCLTLYDKSGYYIEIWFQVGTKETYSTEVNIDRIIKELESDYNVVKDKGDINEN